MMDTSSATAVSATAVSASAGPAAAGHAPQRRGSVRGLAWIAQRAVLGLAIMLAVTGIAAYIAHASIEASDGIDEISIGAHAQPFLGQSNSAD
ncbi:MAG: hypothetical protein SH859_02060 [Hyphomicrobium aestuarii]|nr:hypothetical protein [Hyphomicrobium aestuarii]